MKLSPPRFHRTILLWALGIVSSTLFCFPIYWFLLLPYSGVEKHRSWSSAWFYGYCLVVVVVWVATFTTAYFIIRRHNKPQSPSFERPNEFVLDVKRLSDLSQDQSSHQDFVSDPRMNQNSSFTVSKSKLDHFDQLQPAQSLARLVPPDKRYIEQPNVYTNLSFLQDEIDSFNVIEQLFRQELNPPTMSPAVINPLI